MFNKFEILIAYILSLFLLFSLASCVVNPPPAVEDSSLTSAFSYNKADKELNIGVDNMGSGFNPHIYSNVSEINSLVANLTLPSTFNFVKYKGRVLKVLNKGLIQRVSTRVTNAGYVIQYQLNKNAQWSDGVPITGDDFSYLWHSMLKSTDSIQAVNYRNIKDITAEDAGKTVLVTLFRQTIKWKSLFDNLLPSHLLKSIPGGFEFGLDMSSDMPIPASAGPFKFQSLDWSRGELVLVRNDRYWGTPSTLKNIIFKKISNPKGLLTSIESGSIQAGILHNFKNSLDIKNKAEVKVTRFNSGRYVNLYALNKENKSMQLVDFLVKKLKRQELNSGPTNISANWFKQDKINLFFNKNDEIISNQAGSIQKILKENKLNAVLNPLRLEDLYRVTNLANTLKGINLTLNWWVNDSKIRSIDFKYSHSIYKEDVSFAVNKDLLESQAIKFFTDIINYGKVDSQITW